MSSRGDFSTADIARGGGFGFSGADAPSILLSSTSLTNTADSSAVPSLPSPQSSSFHSPQSPFQSSLHSSSRIPAPDQPESNSQSDHVHQRQLLELSLEKARFDVELANLQLMSEKSKIEMERVKLETEKLAHERLRDTDRHAHEERMFALRLMELQIQNNMPVDVAQVASVLLPTAGASIAEERTSSDRLAFSPEA